MNSASILKPFLCFLAVSAALACSSTTTSTTNGNGSGTPPDCNARCSAKAETCGAPATGAAEQCSTICPKVTSAAQLSCLESSPCAELIRSFSGGGAVCGIGSGTGTDGGTGTVKVGDPCKCAPDSSSGAGEFQCKGTNICDGTMYCVGNRVAGVDNGKCRPRCCDSTTSCGAALGKQGSCGAGQVCQCFQGNECVGSSCTCIGGTTPAIAFCY